MSGDAGGAILIGGALAGVAYLYLSRQAEAEPQFTVTPAQQPAPQQSGGGFNPAPALQWGLQTLFDVMGTQNTAPDWGGYQPQEGTIMNTNNSSNTGGGWLSNILGGLSMGTATANPNTGAAAGGQAGNAGSIGARLMSDLQRDLGLTRAQAAGIVGNLDHESGGFASLQEIAPVVPGSRGGYGYAQWTGPRRRQFEEWAEARGLPLNSYEANYGFLRYELTETPERRGLDAVRRHDTPSGAARDFSNTFLRPGIPHMDSRVSRAESYASGGWA